MLRGRFGNTTTAPYLEAYVSFPRLGHRGYVSFLVDTGADGTVLMPTDSKKLGVNFRSLRNPISSQGVGGISVGFNEQTVLGFSNGRYVYSYLLDIELAAPTKNNQRLPSLLGRDILHKWRFVMEYRKGHAIFTPRRWDLRIKL